MEFLLIACVALVILLLYFGFIKNDLKKSSKNLQKKNKILQALFLQDARYVILRYDKVKI